MSTARVALVPEREDPRRPAWPRALDVLRRLQLPDGGWGEPAVSFSYDRFGSTLAALRALLEWRQPEDARRIERGRAALEIYARQLSREKDFDVIGFEFITSRLLRELEEFGVLLESDLLANVARTREESLARVGSLEVEPDRPRTWWYSMECLPEATLARIDPRLVSAESGIVTSTGATAAYLRAVRLAGGESRAAKLFLDGVVERGDGGASQVWPIDILDLAWSIDAYLQVGISPADPFLRPSIEELHRRWQERPNGVAYSSYFPIPDGDDSVMAYSVLRRAGYAVSDHPLLASWNGRLLEVYPNQRADGISLQIHGLYALRDTAPHRPIHDEMASSILSWLREQLTSQGRLAELWHYSPIYVLGHAISSLLPYEQSLARQCVDRLLDSQRTDGGWGHGEAATEEETGLAVIGLLNARQAGLPGIKQPLRRAAGFLRSHHAGMTARPRLWLAKTLYLPVNVAEAYCDAARSGLRLAGLE